MRRDDIPVLHLFRPAKAPPELGARALTAARRALAEPHTAGRREAPRRHRHLLRWAWIGAVVALLAANLGTYLAWRRAITHESTTSARGAPPWTLPEDRVLERLLQTYGAGTEAISSPTPAEGPGDPVAALYRIEGGGDV